MSNHKQQSKTKQKCLFRATTKTDENDSVMNDPNSGNEEVLVNQNKGSHVNKYWARLKSSLTLGGTCFDFIDDYPAS